MRLWLRYLHEKRQIVLLYFVTAFLFITIGSLYHFENLEKLLYAALLTFVIWGAAAIWGGLRYVGRSRRLEEAARHFEQSGELFPREYWEEGQNGDGEAVFGAQDYGEAFMRLLFLVSGEMEAQRMRWEERTA